MAGTVADLVTNLATRMLKGFFCLNGQLGMCNRMTLFSTGLMRPPSVLQEMLFLGKTQISVKQQPLYVPFVFNEAVE